MEDQKLDNLLNLALDATKEELEKSEELDVGYDLGERTWEVIVRYSGSYQELLADSVLFLFFCREEVMQTKFMMKNTA